MYYGIWVYERGKYNEEFRPHWLIDGNGIVLHTDNIDIAYVYLASVYHRYKAKIAYIGSEGKPVDLEPAKEDEGG